MCISITENENKILLKYQYTYIVQVLLTSNEICPILPFIMTAAVTFFWLKHRTYGK